MKWWPAECEPGDMIRVRVGSVWHYGVFVSEDEVIQFGKRPEGLIDRPEEDTRVLVTDAETFAGGSIIEKAVFDRRERRSRFAPEKTVALARSRLGEGGYDLLYNNCEHFVFECVFGEHRSVQVDELRRRWNTRPGAAGKSEEKDEA